MGGLLFYDWSTLPFVILVLVLSFTIHEFAHAYSAYKLGDSTAYQFGRVSLNPMVHLDLFGTIMLLIAGIGWAKPVPVNRGNFKRPRLMGIIVTAAGPLSNLILAFISIFVFVLFQKYGWLKGMSVGSSDAIVLFLQLMITINLRLFLFNLIPIPPLDGYRIIQDVVNLKYSESLIKFEQWASVIFLLVVFIGPLRRVTLDPYLGLIFDIADFLSKPISWMLGM
ncbi:site-2 protease family protein [Paenibacillus alginolyticus]|uniref:Site-2 protease family protein n=1 Tax=Paenibacillus alginolyticus TaxID=59839 RepID=A0ABT4GG38_9BACL|nr:site-2 protease family protein [Paenibacillus alginolyticus]MCY9695152.1 site-2 protease family protein [Paenibacillus alginolyticus]MEC0148681.1 site-2 protease family protein [Paenibacillus alginolyticus]